MEKEKISFSSHVLILKVTFQALSEDVTLEWMRTIINQIIDTYDLETTVRWSVCRDIKHQT